MEPLWPSEDPILRPLEDWQLNLAIIVAILVNFGIGVAILI
jgi:hypothetical protein